MTIQLPRLRSDMTKQTIEFAKLYYILYTY